MLGAVIFDMDGTLIDTEKLNVRFWMEAGRLHGHPITRDEVLHIRSLDGRLAREFLESRHPGMDFGEVREERRRLMADHVEREGLELKPHVVDALERIRSMGIKTAVATASRPDHAFGYLEMLGILQMFDEVVCTSSVEHGKPSPDVYLYACERVGERPSDCLAVEDSPNGVRSAYDAGCRVAFVPDLTGPDDEIRSKATVFGDLGELADRIGSLRGGPPGSLQVPADEGHRGDEPLELDALVAPLDDPELALPDLVEEPDLLVVR